MTISPPKLRALFKPLILAAAFTVGLGAGALWAEKISREERETIAAVRRSVPFQIILTLCYLAKSDRQFTDTERRIIVQIARQIGLNSYQQILATYRVIDFGDKNGFDARSICRSLNKTLDPQAKNSLIATGKAIIASDGAYGLPEQGALGDIMEHLGLPPPPPHRWFSW
ncbi:MAG: hypothetical protein Q8Q08_10365 [Candidatus Omnitrophota bacterium]|nr:hypothetical protein [Candidatus Omnitrophota bacterium]MDZ4242887.1 hypothetical protein [Candidatus Omnitrophota bacterium]